MGMSSWQVFWLEGLHYAVHLDDMLSMLHILWLLVILLCDFVGMYCVNTMADMLSFCR